MLEVSCARALAPVPDTPRAVTIAAVNATLTPPAPRPGRNAVHGWRPRLGWARRG